MKKVFTITLIPMLICMGSFAQEKTSFQKGTYNDGYGSGYGIAGKSGGVAVGVYAGAHYHFSPHFGVYGELGFTSFSILNLGVAFKF